jgi:hypothetical protein
MHFVVGQAGFGALEVIPMEIRQEIYASAFDIDRAVTVKHCCLPGKTQRERDGCPKHGNGSKSGGRFNVLQVSKAIRDEAMFVVYGKGSLSLDTQNAIAPYLDGWRSTSIRGIINL